MRKLFAGLIIGGIAGFWLAKNPDFFKGWGKKNGTPPAEGTSGKPGKTADDYIQFLQMHGSYSIMDLKTKTLAELDTEAKQFADYIKW